MAKLHSHLAVLSFILFVLFRSPVFSRTMGKNPKTSLLDVSNPKIFQLAHREELHQKGDSSFTVTLCAQDSLGLSPLKNNRDSTLARFKRNAERVNSHSRKLNSVNQENAVVPVISNKAQNSYNYLVRFGIGTPDKQLYVTVDTGTAFTWKKCLTDSEFDPTESSSYKLASEFDIPELSFTTCINGKCSYQIKYADESSSSGSLATETFTFGSSVIKEVIFGCGHDNQGDTLAGTNGILGLGVGPASFPSQIKANSFSYCLVARESASSSTLSFGSSIPGDAITIPFTERNSYYTLSLTGIRVGSTFFSASDQEFTSETPLDMDSGAFITLLTTRTYNAIHDEFVMSINLPSVEPSDSIHSPIDTCFNIPSGATVPRVAFHFGDTILELPKENYLLPDPKDQHVACFAFAPTEESSGVLGNFQQQGF